MKYFSFVLIIICHTLIAQEVNDSQKTIHIFVALCDNKNQGIVPVSKTLGDGQNPKTNLYWGALYGVKTHFKRSADWSFIKTIPSENSKILERALFKHKESNTYLLAEAYDGLYIKDATADFLKAASGLQPTAVITETRTLSFGGGADLVGYIGHDGLMEFNLDMDLTKNPTPKDAIILACISKDYFAPYLSQTGANPLVWTTGLMAPEAYTLKAAIDGWILNEDTAAIRERAAQAYHQYQKCGMNGARRLLVSGY